MPTSREQEVARQLAALSPAELDELLRTGELVGKFRTQHKALLWKPVPKQIEFIALSANKTETAIFAGNQEGKSETGAFALACHLTGIYPDWWPGRKWDRATNWWMAGKGGVAVRDAAQTKLFGTPGDPEALGTGMIPRDCIIGKPTASHSATNAIDTALVRHVSGGVSRLVAKTYEMKVGMWQGPTLDGIWCDEEPPMNLYTEGLARLSNTNGLMMVTFTPLQGYKEVVPRFLRETDPEAAKYRGVVRMTLNDALWYSEEDKRRLMAQYPAHERAARINGEPFLGSGAVFYGISPESLHCAIPLSAVPPHWFKLWCLDFGIAHPFAAVLLAWDKDTDTLYVLHTIRMKDKTPVQHAAAMRAIDINAPVAWPHDGNDRDKGSGIALSKIYRDQGLNMMSTHATLPDGGYQTEAGVALMMSYMEGGRFKVNTWCNDWYDEFMSYYREEGLIVKVNDDLMSATRTGVIQRRSAQHGSIGNTFVERMRGGGQRTAIVSSDPWSGI